MSDRSRRERSGGGGAAQAVLGPRHGRVQQVGQATAVGVVEADLAEPAGGLAEVLDLQDFALIGQVPAERPPPERAEPAPRIDGEDLPLVVDADLLQVVEQPRLGRPAPPAARGAAPRGPIARRRARPRRTRGPPGAAASGRPTPARSLSGPAPRVPARRVAPPVAAGGSPGPGSLPARPRPPAASADGRPAPSDAPRPPRSAATRSPPAQTLGMGTGPWRRPAGSAGRGRRRPRPRPAGRRSARGRGGRGSSRAGGRLGSGAARGRRRRTR